MMIVADYQKIHSKDGETFVAKWKNFKTVALSLFLSKIQGVQRINLLKTLFNQSEDTKDVLLFHVIHSALIPSKRGKRGSSGNLKDVQDSRVDFIISKSSVGDFLSQSFINYLYKLTAMNDHVHGPPPF
nr:uncharacterized protein LOC118877228 [Drosophila suzukii]